MDAEFKYDDSNLQKLFKELEPKERIKSLRAVFRIAGNKVRKTTVAIIRQSVNSNKELEKGVKVRLWKEVAGFRVTVGSGKYHSKRFTGSSAREVPVLRWLDTGTDDRSTGGRKVKGFKRLFSRKGSKGHATGRLKRYAFMAKTKGQTESSVTTYVRDATVLIIKRLAKKYGCN